MYSVMCVNSTLHLYSVLCVNSKLHTFAAYCKMKVLQISTMLTFAVYNVLEYPNICIKYILFKCTVILLYIYYCVLFVHNRCQNIYCHCKETVQIYVMLSLLIIRKPIHLKIIHYQYVYCNCILMSSVQ